MFSSAPDSVPEPDAVPDVRIGLLAGMESLLEADIASTADNL